MVSDESAVMYRIGAFGVSAAVVYWFVSYEWLGSFALLTLGLGPMFAGFALGMAERGRLQSEGSVDTVRRLAGFPRPEPKGIRHRLTADRLMLIPSPSVWPFVLSLGVSIALTGLVFGTWLLLLGGILTVWGLWGWVAAIGHETHLGHLQPEPSQTAGQESGADPRHAAPGLPREPEGESAAQQPPPPSSQPASKRASASESTTEQETEQESEPPRVASGAVRVGRQGSGGSSSAASGRPSSSDTSADAVSDPTGDPAAGEGGEAGDHGDRKGGPQPG